MRHWPDEGDGVLMVGSTHHTLSSFEDIGVIWVACMLVGVAQRCGTTDYYYDY